MQVNIIHFEQNIRRLPWRSYFETGATGGKKARVWLQKLLPIGCLPTVLKADEGGFQELV